MSPQLVNVTNIVTRRPYMSQHLWHVTTRQEIGSLIRHVVSLHKQHILKPVWYHKSQSTKDFDPCTLLLLQTTLKACCSFLKSKMMLKLRLLLNNIPKRKNKLESATVNSQPNNQLLWKAPVSVDRFQQSMCPITRTRHKQQQIPSDDTWYLDDISNVCASNADDPCQLHLRGISQ